MELLVGLRELDLIGVRRDWGRARVGVRCEWGVCWPMPPYPSSLYVHFVQIQFNSLPLSSRKKSKRGYWNRERAILALWTPLSPPFNLPFYKSPFSAPLALFYVCFCKICDMTCNEIFAFSYKYTP